MWLSWWRIRLQCERPGLGRSPRERKGYPLQYSGLENSMDCIAHGITKSQTQLSGFHYTRSPHRALAARILKQENTDVRNFKWSQCALKWAESIGGVCHTTPSSAPFPAYLADLWSSSELAPMLHLLCTVSLTPNLCHATHFTIRMMALHSYLH